MKRFLDENPRLSAAGAAGLIVFLALFGRAFMGKVRPEPLSRDELAHRALDFAALEGWEAANRVAWTNPIEGDDFATVQSAAAAAGIAVPDRETLPDPAWETFVITNPRSISSGIRTFTPPDPLLSIATTPEGEVVQYIEITSPIAGQSVNQSRRERMPPFYELETDGIFETNAENRRTVSDEDRASIVASAAEFFARHQITVAGSPKSLFVCDGSGNSRLAYVSWEAPGPAGTVDLTRLVVWNGRVAAYDRDLRPPVATPAEPKSNILGTVTASSTALILVFGCTFIVVLMFIKRRQGELDLRSATTVFLTVACLATLNILIWIGMMLGIFAFAAGYTQTWFLFTWLLVSAPFTTIAMSLMVAGAWATSEGQAYFVWPQHLVRPFSALVRGNLRSPEAAGPVAAGYAAAFAALGAATAIGLVAPAATNGSVAPLRALYDWPITLGAPVQGLNVGLMLTIVAGIFAMTYTRMRTRRLWIVVLVGMIATLGLRVTFWPQQYFPGDVSVAVAVVVGLAVGLCVVFVRYGPLASFTACFVYSVAMISYPLILSGNLGHAQSGAWSMLLGVAPAAVAAYGVWRPQVQKASSVPAHVRRALDRLRIGEEFEVARRVQASLLPTAAPYIAGLDVAGICVPANEVGGDYFDYFKLADDRLGVAIGDVSGKGVGAAIYMTLTKSYMVTQTLGDRGPVSVLTRVNEHLRRNLSRGTFVTMVYAVLDASRGRLEYTRAGHNPPLLLRAGGEGDFLNAPGIALGAAGRSVFESVTRVESVDLLPGDLVVFYTDGVTEAMTPRGDEYGEQRLIDQLRRLAASPASAADVVDALLRDVRAFAGRAPQHDDITIVAIRCANHEATQTPDLHFS